MFKRKKMKTITCCLKEQSRDWAGGFITYTLATQTWGPVFDSQNPHKKPNTMAYSLILALIPTQTDSWVLPSSQCILASELQARGRHCLQSELTKSGWNLRNSAHTSSRLHTPMYINTHARACSRVHAHTHIYSVSQAYQIETSLPFLCQSPFKWRLWL